MRRPVTIFFVMILMFSFCFVLPGLTQETKEGEGPYTIKKGDTLWDISSKFLKDPFLWPKLWERNPYITNPHLIFPGNSILLSAAEPVKKEEPKTVVEEKPKEVVKEVKEVKEAEVQKVESPLPPVEKKEEVVVVNKPAKVEDKPLYFPEVRDAGFMTDIPYRGIGIVLEGKEGKSLMACGDIVYLAFRTSEPILIGNKYTILRAGREIKHPVTSRTLGRKYIVMGNVQIIDQQGSFFAGKITESFYPIEVGDLIQPYSKEKMEGDFGK
ncbi:MAG: LysM peptidoglycan-binding domain-containing protein [Thermodesulfobacteriota bacterium]